ncbi:MAG: rod-binding protein [Treponema sp.]|jgi:flagellar protein FlgJ|nr:rod-binding protein [Treponema sp.]
MGVETTGALYLDDVRFTSSALGNRKLPAAGTGTGFDHLLEKAQAAASSEPGAAPQKRVIDKTDKLYEQCQALESFLVKTLLTSMRNTVQKSELLDGGFAGDMYEDMLYDEYAQDFTKNAHFGLAELAYLELTNQSF